MTYDKDGREKEVRVAGKFTRSTDYDNLGRVTKQSFSAENGDTSMSMTYKYPDAEKNKEYALPSEMDVQEMKAKGTNINNQNRLNRLSPERISRKSMIRFRLTGNRR